MREEIKEAFLVFAAVCFLLVALFIGTGSLRLTFAVDAAVGYVALAGVCYVLATRIKSN
ncbi:hypothetical protein [Streptomyces sp. NPDC056401]|uniref:hypothetical protein n=1 Tax=Streptomyces sp. NPDC056401 TaxID=3345809 RepID=UPI0035DAD8DE